MSLREIVHKIRRRLLKIRLRPIRVFVFHQVSDSFDSRSMWKCDWTETEQFKKSILNLKDRYQFISLTDAVAHLNGDFIRREEYAVLTCDDGWNSVLSILPWLVGQQIPVTLFLNPAFLQGLESLGNGMDDFFKEEDLSVLLKKYSGITVASHGWNHRFCTDMSFESFRNNVNASVTYLKRYPQFVPFFAYPCGRHTYNGDRFLRENGLFPVYCDGMKNYGDPFVIHRECIDDQYLKDE